VSEESKNLPVPTPSANSVKTPRQRPLWTAIAFLLLGVIALALVIGFQWQQRQALEQRVSQLSQSVDDVGAQRQSVESQVTDRLRRLESNQEEQGDRQQEMERRIDQAARSLLQMGNRTRNDWLLAEAEYLMRIANQRLRMERDIDGALALLQNADKVLEESEDMGAYPVRQELAREIQALKAIENVDRVGLYLQLEAAIEQVDSLTTSSLAATTPLDTASAPTGETDTTADSPLLEAWQDVKQTLAEVVVIRRLDEPVKPLLSPRQSAYANLNLRLMLEEAEMALLSAEPVLYRRSLAKAQDWLGRWYNESNSKVSGLMQTLESLAQRQIKPDLPDISDSLNLLKARINGRLSADDTDAGNPQPENSQGSQPES
jgi:uroporphyrin-3 C-methyltransferase